LVIEGTSAETSRLLREASAPASAFGTKPVIRIASRILASVAGETLDGSLIARDTVTCDTPASRPMVAMVTARPRGGIIRGSGMGAGPPGGVAGREYAYIGLHGDPAICVKGKRIP
jgi:hypothetical protein